MLKKTLAGVAALVAAFCSFADSWTDPDTGIEWRYELMQDGSVSVAGVQQDSSGGALVIPEKMDGRSVTSIGDHAFDGCSGLTSVTIPSSVTSIGYWAFSGCSGLTSVTIPSSVTSIGDLAFLGCSGLTSVTIPSSVTSIGDSAFDCCSGLTSVTIPTSVTSIGNCAFGHCGGLMSIDVDAGNPEYKSVNGLLLTKDGKTLISGVNGNVTIPTGVTSIGEWAFSSCSGLTSVTIPSGVTKIGTRAFDGCSGLMTIDVKAGNPVYKSVNGLLLTKDGKTLISGVNGNVTIPTGVTSIGDYAFSGCSGLTSVTIPSSVTSIRGSAFAGCGGLMSIDVDAGNPEYKSVNGLLLTKDGKTLISGVNGNVTIPTGVTSIGDWAFHRCRGLTSVMIPSGVTSIGFWAFYGCDALAKVYVDEGDAGRVKGLLEALGFDTSDLIFATGGAEDPVVQVRVRFDPNGGACSTAFRDVEKGGTIGALPIPTRVGYDFLGWFTAAEGGVQVTAGNVVSSEMEIFAHWKRIAYVITYQLDGGVNAAGNPTSYTVEDAVTLVPPTREGCLFKGWTPDGGVIAKGSTGDKTFTATWEPAGVVKHVVTFDANGGTVGETSREVMAGSGIGELPIPTRGGYVFGHWTKSVNGEGSVWEDTVVDADMTLYAQWTKIEEWPTTYYTVSAGFDIDDVGDSVVIMDPGEADGTLRAYYNDIDEQGRYFEGYHYHYLPECPYTRLGYTFAGWECWDMCRPSDISGKSGKYGAYIGLYQAGEMCDICGFGGIVAMWVKSDQTTVWLDANGGNVSPSSKSCAVGSACGALPTPTRDGYDFLGWFTSKEGGVKVTEGNVVSSDVTLYAHWKRVDQGRQTCSIVASGKVDVELGLVGYEATGLPAGLKFDAKKGKVTGVCKTAGAYTVTFLKRGADDVVLTFEVVALPAWAMGSYNGRRDDGEGAVATMTVGTGGKVSGKFSDEGKMWSFSATTLEPTDGLFVVETTAKSGKETRVVWIAIDEGGASGTIYDGESATQRAVANLTFWRNAWKEAGATTRLAPFAGLYTVQLSGDESGTGYLSLTLDAKGNCKATGKLPDGTSASGTLPLVWDEAAGAPFAVWQMAPSAYKGGCVGGLLKWSARTSGAGATVDGGDVVWISRAPMATGEYGEGFERTISAHGAWYDKGGRLWKLYEDALAFSADSPSLDVQGEQVDSAELVCWNNLTVSIDEKGTGFVVDQGKATKPVKGCAECSPDGVAGWTYEGANDAALTLKFAKATGIFKGSFTCWYDYLDQNGKLKHTSKKADFEGVMVQGEPLRGFYLWERQSTSGGNAYKYKESRPVVFE